MRMLWAERRSQELVASSENKRRGTLQNFLDRGFQVLHGSLADKGAYLFPHTVVQKQSGKSPRPVGIDPIGELIVIRGVPQKGWPRDFLVLEDLDGVGFLFRLVGRDSDQ